MDRGPHTGLADETKEAPDGPGLPFVHVYTRDGFTGVSFAAQPAAYPPNYISAIGPHFPRRWILPEISALDRDESETPPELLANSKRVRLRFSGRRAPNESPSISQLQPLLAWCDFVRSG